jgi:hypothetical protein
MSMQIPGSQIRLLMVTNEHSPGTEYGLRDEYTTMAQRGEIESFDAIAPEVIAGSSGSPSAAAEMHAIAEAARPNVVLVLSPKGLGHDASWVAEWIVSAGNPVVLYWEGDPWQRWVKPPNASMHAWLAAADVVFAVARKPEVRLFQRAGARDVRFIPHTYCHVQFAAAEAADPREDADIKFDAVLIGSRLAHFGLISRVPGAAGRASLVRRLERGDRRLAVYGVGWNGKAAMSLVPYSRQIAAIREGLMSVNWDHFPRHESYASDRLPTSLLAGRAHVTTAHRGLEWLPGPDTGLFLEPTVSAVVRRVDELRSRPTDEVLELGAAAHDWVKNRLSDREAARFMLGAVDESFLTGLPSEPWHRFVA